MQSRAMGIADHILPFGDLFWPKISPLKTEICLNSTLKKNLSGLFSALIPDLNLSQFNPQKKTFSGLYSALIPDPVTVLQSIKSILKCAFPGRLEIHPRVLQDVSPLGPLPCSHSTASADHSKQGIGYR